MPSRGQVPTARSRPRWSTVLRGLRESRGISQDGWAAQLGIGRTTLQRWETGASPPGAEAETALLRLCEEQGLYRRYDHGPLQGMTLTPALLRDLLAEARLSEGGAATPEPAREPTASLLSASARPQPGNLPLPTSAFVGREREIEELRGLVRDGKLVTITGIGGIGKTRLALELASRLDGFPDGIWLVELAPITNPALAIQALASALGIVEEGRQSLHDSIVQRLTTATALIVLDNCEHVREAAAELAGMLLRACPGLKLIATSRQSLGLPGEVSWRLPPLAVPQNATADGEATEAEALFLDRARSALPALTLSRSAAQAVRSICRRLDGIPLAIELAAARVRVLTPEQIAARLDDRFRLLAGGATAFVERQRTLRAALDWSYDPLSEAEKALFRRLSVFAAGCELEAAEAVCAGDTLAAEAVLDAVDQLVDRSLLPVEYREGVARYRYLETVREYAIEQLRAAQEGRELHQRLLAWCLALAESAEQAVQGPEQQQWLDRLGAEHDNLRAALEWSLSAEGDLDAGLRLATALRPYWFTRGYVSEGRRWLARLLVNPSAESLSRARALDAAAILAHSQGELAAASGLLDASLALWRSLDDQRGMANALNLRGIIEKDLGNRATAVGALEEALAFMQALGDQRREATVLNNLAAVASDAAEYDRAEALHTASLSIKRALGDRVGVAVSLANLAEVERLRGNFAASVSLAQEAAELARQLGAPMRIAQALQILGVSLARLGRLDAGEAALREALTVFRDQESLVGVALCCEGLAITSAGAGSWERVTELLAGAASIRASLGVTLTEADQRACDELLNTASAVLDASVFDAAIARGRGRTPNEVAAAALAP